MNVLRRLFIAWDGTNYVEETARLLVASGANRLTPPGEPGLSSRGQVDQCDLTLDNSTGRYSAMNENSPLNDGTETTDALINGNAYHRPMYLEVSIDNGANYYRIFTGVIKLPQENAPTSKQAATVKIDCRSLDERLLQRRMSTLLSAMTAWHDAGYREGQMIEALLLNANVIDYETDEGMFLVPFAWLDDESVLDEIWQIAGATGGRVYCDPNGTMRYEDATHWLKSPHDTSQEIFTRDKYKTLTPIYSDGDLYNVVTAETSPREIDLTDVLWEPDELVSVPPDSAKNMTARLRQAAYAIDQITVKASTISGTDISADVTIDQTNYVQRVELVITNANTTHTAYLRPLQITGQALKGGPTQEEKRTSADDGNNAAWWAARSTTRTRTIRGNPYIQTRAQAGAVALMLLHRAEAPRLTFKIGGVMGDPERRCGDRITIDDTAIMSASHDAFITGISWRYDSAGFTQDLEAVDAASLYPYADGDGYFVLGTNKVGTGTLSAYLFY